jgi:short-chain fatty acids transporter
MRFFRIIEKVFTSLLPSPLSIAILLTILTLILAWFAMDTNVSGTDRLVELVGFWEQGLWDAGMLKFAFQMMLMRVLGHILALTNPADRIVQRVTRYCTNTANAAGIITLLTVLVALFNWGLGLIFGAILARKVGEHATRNALKLNYPIIGAAGYSGLMVWHGGISGSAPIKAAEPGHVTQMMNGISAQDQLLAFPESYPFSDTIFGGMNLLSITLLVVLLPLFMFWIGKRFDKAVSLPVLSSKNIAQPEKSIKGAERLDFSKWFASFVGGMILVYIFYKAIKGFPDSGFGFITPDFINLLLLGAGLFLHRSIRSFIQALEEAIGGASGILIQFPLYFGILGIMKSAGMVTLISDFFVAYSNEITFPIYTFFSAGIVNIFVPSGGGQWSIQGPIILQAAQELGVSGPKAIMALAYGDQITNMLQPFWALPLLGITGLKARAILPYTFALMLIGTLIYVTVLFLY